MNQAAVFASSGPAAELAGACDIAALPELAGADVMASDAAGAEAEDAGAETAGAMAAEDAALVVAAELADVLDLATGLLDAESAGVFELHAALASSTRAAHAATIEFLLTTKIHAFSAGRELWAA